MTSERPPTLTITVSDAEEGVLETLYTDAALIELCDVLREHAVVFDTEKELATAREENDRG